MGGKVFFGEENINSEFVGNCFGLVKMGILVVGNIEAG